MSKLPFNLSKRALGTIITVAAIMIVTPDSLLVRKLQHLPDFTMMFYRYLMYGALFLLIVIGDSLYRDDKPWYYRWLKLGWVGWSAGVAWAAFNLLITYGLQTTAAGTVLVINASNPMFSALFTFLLMREVVPWYTILASLVCFAAIFSVFYSSLSEATASDTVGMVSAVGAAASVGLYLVLLSYAEKHHLEFDSYLCIVISAVIICVVSLIIEPNQQLARASDWGLLFANGVLVLGFSNVLLNVGPTMISAPEVSLIFLLETIFGPVWVYLGGYEAPPSSAVYGGAVLIATLVTHSVVAMRYDAAAAAAGDATSLLAARDAAADEAAPSAAPRRSQKRSQKPSSSKAAGAFAALHDADDFGADEAL